MNQIINMIIRQVMRRVINAGINKGVDVFANRGKGGDGAETPEDRAQARQTSRRMKQGARTARKIGRM
ncbi:hypothetical protein DDZ14_02070 [Maritimibacter sp. 55A14]|uniref:hypothetical protein n=1 Tax=Maritimibacter sp. 55A14 TaxID=2174844 RepID=UPI000D62058F|nr:hypothetical protein [Maritimibacter sp. 55A14]PWE33972.1 hypothetical protein DDZ14_02070 [Maritimibacter sp. 55A14]